MKLPDDEPKIKTVFAWPGLVVIVVQSLVEGEVIDIVTESYEIQ